MMETVIKCPSCGKQHKFFGAFPYHKCPWCGASLITHLMGKGKNTGEKMERISITLPYNTIRILNKLCKKLGIKRAAYIRALVDHELTRVPK